MATSPLGVGAAAAVTTAGAASSPALFAKKEFVDAVAKAANNVEKTGHYANGVWIHVRDGRSP
ncbi:MAG: hypothetical protein M1830_007692 [Pleopsidium flavum]|nr:MAG: hypothetical protein M1830_007692 [Pleopsidium flavum]